MITMNDDLNTEETPAYSVVLAEPDGPASWRIVFIKLINQRETGVMCTTPDNYNLHQKRSLAR